MKAAHPSQGGWRVETHGDVFQSRCVVNCAGLHADRVAAFFLPSERKEQIIPFRGEYYLLKPERRHLIRHMIYPVPDPRFPFLGVHFTRTLEGQVEAGPNAIMALAREGYSWSNISLRDMAQCLSFPGFWRMAWRYPRMGAAELLRSLSKKAFVKALQRLVPAINEEDLTEGPTGVRAQLVLRDGGLFDDFLIRQNGTSFHVLNAPSPGATSCLAIGEQLVALLQRQMGWGS